MTVSSSISSDKDPRAFLKKGFKSMFANYSIKQETVPPVDTEKDRKKQCSS